MWPGEVAGRAFRARDGTIEEAAGERRPPPRLPPPSLPPPPHPPPSPPRLPPPPLPLPPPPHPPKPPSEAAAAPRLHDLLPPPRALRLDLAGDAASGGGGGGGAAMAAPLGTEPSALGPRLPLRLSLDGVWPLAAPFVPPLLCGFERSERGDARAAPTPPPPPSPAWALAQVAADDAPQWAWSPAAAPPLSQPLPQPPLPPPPPPPPPPPAAPPPPPPAAPWWRRQPAAER